MLQATETKVIEKEMKVEAGTELKIHYDTLKKKAVVTNMKTGFTETVGRKEYETITETITDETKKESVPDFDDLPKSAEEAEYLTPEKNTIVESKVTLDAKASYEITQTSDGKGIIMEDRLTGEKLVVPTNDFQDTVSETLTAETKEPPPTFSFLPQKPKPKKTIVRKTVVKTKT